MRSSIATSERRQPGASRRNVAIWAGTFLALVCFAALPAVGQKADAKKSTTKKPTPPAKVVRLRGIPSMNITKELISDAEAEQLGDRLRKVDRYSNILQKGEMDAKARRVMNDWARWRVYSMTLKSMRVPPPPPPANVGPMGKGKAKPKKAGRTEPSNLKEVYTEIMRKIRGSGKLLARRNPAAGRQFRTILCKAVADRAAELLDNNFRVRIYAVLILSQMNVVDWNPVKKTLPIAYLPAADILITKVLNAQQPEPVKIVAVNGIRRLTLLAQPLQADRRRMAAALLPLLANRQNFVWLQARAARALGAVGEKTNGDGQADIVQTLTKAMADQARTPPVRCAAARALGRADMANSVDVPFIVHEIARLAKEMAEKYNADCAAKKAGNIAAVPAYWPKCFLDIFLAFHPKNSEETKLYANRKPGLLRRFNKKPGVMNRYLLIKPICRHVILQGQQAAPGQNVTPVFMPIRKPTVDSLDKFLAGNKPSVDSVQPGILPALRGGMKAAGINRNGNGGTKQNSAVSTGR